MKKRKENKEEGTDGIEAWKYEGLACWDLGCSTCQDAIHGETDR